MPPHASREKIALLGTATFACDSAASQNKAKRARLSQSHCTPYVIVYVIMSCRVVLCCVCFLTPPSRLLRYLSVHRFQWPSGLSCAVRADHHFILQTMFYCHKKKNASYRLRPRVALLNKKKQRRVRRRRGSQQSPRRP